jgi:Raf kinase inhibitor-like YbhB/YbcL family protein
MSNPKKAALRHGLSILAAVILVTVPPAVRSAAAEEDRPDDPRRSAMQLSSAAFDPGERIPDRHTCDGQDLSPPLAWSEAPEGTRSLTLIMDDPDAPPGTWVHWVLYNLPADGGGLEEGVPKNASLDSGASHGVCWGVDSYSRVGYHGPCPPPGTPHRYSFRLFALDSRLDLPAKATKEQVERAMEGHILARTELVGIYGR